MLNAPYLGVPLLRSFRALTLACLVSTSFLAPTLQPSLSAQSTISGDIAGTVIDPSGAAVSGATITAVNVADGSVKKDMTTSTGSYHLSLLKPGTYRISITGTGFDTTVSTVTVTTGSVANGDAKLSLGSSSTSIEVTDAVPLLQTEDAQITTTFTMEQVQALPNPGGDITYYAQTAPGVVMNTGGGYGNFSVFGLPGTSNNFTVNGEQENDPFLNLNNSGPTNLLLGANDISTVSVITSAYGAEFGSFGGAQINEISRSGTNRFHGDASYWWNGRSLNANDWFNKAAGGTRPFTNDNQWAASVGGPIVKDRAFFFVNTEGIRFITAPTDTNFVPTPAYEKSIVGNNGLCNDSSSNLYLSGTGVGGENECAFYNKAFALFNSAPGIANAKPTTPQIVGQLPNGQPYYNTVDSTATGPVDSESFVSTPAIFAKESLITGRVDYFFGPKDTAFAHMKYDTGTQPSNVDPISSLFNDISNQPEWEGQLVETHVFNPNLTNQFLGTIAHYSAYFQNPNQAAATAALPMTIVFGEGYFNNLGGAGYVFPQGRNATQYQFADDVSWTHKAHTVKVGYAWKKDDITNFDTGIYTNPLVVALEDEQDGLFADGYEYYYRQTFPDHLSNPNALYTEGFYASDTYKLSKNLQLSAGIRFEINSNPACPHNCFSRLGQNFTSFLASTQNSVSTPYNSVVQYGLGRAFVNYQPVSYEPRFEAVYSPTEKTVIRGGFGMFSDSFPGQVADNLLRNTPQDPRFQPLFGTFDPSFADSGTQLAASAANTFKHGTTNFYNGGSYSALSKENSAIVRPNLSTADTSIHYPTYEEYSLQIQREITKELTVEVAYAGNHGYHEPVEGANANAYGQFGGFSATRPASEFATVTTLGSGASSNYNGVLVSVIHRSKLLTAQLNYTHSHTLDQVSNGGFLGFTGSAITGPIAPNTLAYNYGNADYDIRNSLNGNYLINLPAYGTSHLMKTATAGWQLAGTVFYRSGFPFTITDSNISNSLTYYSGGIPAATVAGKAISHTCSGVLAAASAAGCLNSANYTDPTGLIAGQRNQYAGPHYFNTDLTLNKAFDLPFESSKFIVGAVFYNVFNHPNFANPTSDIGNPNFGHTFSTVSVPTSIYGSGLGGDASIRIIQLHAKVSF